MDENEQQIPAPYTIPDTDKGLSESDVRGIIADMLANFNLPSKVSGGYLQSANFITGVQGWQLRNDGAEINGSFSVTLINIPDATTANSFHVDNQGNTWWGANVATGYAGAPAYVLKDGSANFKNISIGGSSVQFVIGNNGLFSFGDGNDGAAVLDGSATPAGMTKSGSDYTLTRDVYYTDMTMSTGTTLDPARYRIFGTGTLLMNGTARIFANGNAGSAGGDGHAGSGLGNPPSDGHGGAGGAGGTALAAGYLVGTVAGGAGGAGSNGKATNPYSIASAGTSGTAGTSISANGLGVGGSSGGAGGGCNDGGSGGSAGAGGTVTAANVRLIDPWSVHWMLDIASSGTTVKYNGAAASGGGGGGSGGGGDSVNANGSEGGGGGGGGGGGSPGGFIAIYFRVITIGASAIIESNGGAGGNGGNGGNAGGGSDARPASGGGTGGGGAGGPGGEIILAYNQLNNSGTIRANGGTKGLKGATVGVHFSTSGGLGPAVDGILGSDGNDGSAGDIREFQLSL